MLCAKELSIRKRALCWTLERFRLSGNRFAAWIDSRTPATASCTETLFARLAVLGALVCGLSPAMAANNDYPFRLVTRGGSTGHQVVAENNGPAPITVHVFLTGGNFASDRTWPMTIVVPANATLPLGRIYPSARNRDGYNFLFRYRYHFGRLDAVHDANAVYRLPFEDGRGFLVNQAYGGPLSSHNNHANMYAVDFAMPSGSAVVAARDGVVINVTLLYHKGGEAPRYIDRANVIAIAHDDGTVAQYGHLSPGPATVRVGQQVAAGDLLGYSGSTGYVSGPHLHFIVSRPSVVDGTVSLTSVPVLFYTNDPALHFSAKFGTTLWANYGKPAMPDAQRPAQIAARSESRL